MGLSNNISGMEFIRRKLLFVAGKYTLSFRQNVIFIVSILSILFSSSPALSQSNQDYNFEVVRVKNNLELHPVFGISCSQQYSSFFLGDLDKNEAYVHPVYYSFGLCFSLANFGLECSASVFPLSTFKNNELMNLYFNNVITNNDFMNLLSYSVSKGYYYIGRDNDDYIDYDILTSSLSESFYFKMLGDVSLRNIYLRSENQNKTKAALFGKIVLEHRTIGSKDKIMPEHVSSHYDDIRDFSGLSAATIAPMISGIVNFRLFTDNITLALGAGAGPNFIWNYDIEGGLYKSAYSISPKADALAAVNFIGERFYISVMSTADIFITQIDSKFTLYQADCNSRIITGIRF